MKNHKFKNPIIATCLILLAVGGTILAFQMRGTSANNALETIAVTRGTLQEAVTAQGKLEPKDYVDVGVQVSGQLEKLHVDIGSIVKKGDLIAELDPSTYKSRFAADEAKLNSLKAQLLEKTAEKELSESLFKRGEELLKINAVSQEEMDTKTAELKKSIATVQSLEAQIAEAQANLDNDKINIGYTSIYAPMDGVVSDQIAREGQTLNANQTTPKIIQIANLDIMTVRVQVAEADIMRLKPDMETAFSTLGSMDKKWKGKIRQILPTPELINDVVLYNVLIDVDNSDHALMNGMSTQVFFETAKAENVLILPAYALGKRLASSDSASGTAYTVKVQTPHGAKDRTIHVGMMTRTQAEVRDGLEEGEKVIAPTADATTSTTTKKPSGPPMGPRL
ncbi:MAG: efflux RND transporter periplasmic adaptor subunit [Alphaproteobacteria bacterium]|nr:efflux RND transporter periplasmic adaptor subunit [Alphaproteobacteria bacterium]